MFLDITRYRDNMVPSFSTLAFIQLNMRIHDPGCYPVENGKLGFHHFVIFHSRTSSLLTDLPLPSYIPTTLPTFVPTLHPIYLLTFQPMCLPLYGPSRFSPPTTCLPTHPPTTSPQMSVIHNFKLAKVLVKLGADRKLWRNPLNRLCLLLKGEALSWRFCLQFKSIKVTWATVVYSATY